MGTKTERRVARAVVASYHVAQLRRAARARGERHRALRGGELDVFDLDELIHHYERPACELWKFCWGRGAGAHVQLVARLLEEQAAAGERVDWWAEAAAPR